MLEARGFRATFAVNPVTFEDESNRMTADEVADLSARGHEIANHSMHHVNMTQQTSAERAAAWDEAQAAILAVTGKTPTSFFYPYNVTNLTIDQQAYLRFDRAFTGSNTPFLESMRDRDTFLHGRFSWSNDSASIHQRAMANLHRTAHDEIVFTIFTHKTDGSSGSVTLAQLTEFLDACVTLGVPVMPTDEAFPSYNILSDPGFEATDARFLSVSGLNATNTYSKPVITPYGNMAGTRALRLTGDGTSTIVAMQQNFIPIRSSEPWTLSARFKQTRTSGGGSSLIIREHDTYGAQIGADIVSPTLNTTFDWQQVTLDYTPSALARSFRVGVRQVTMAGVTEYDHMALDLKRRPALG
jgi:peptidoglycan/xylan/chitin deacetylase (PgdA/CDA1 family)